MNKSILIGRLAKEPELRYSPKGTALCDFALAVNRSWAKEDEQQADFLLCCSYGKTAELIANHLHKGNRCAVEGRIANNEYMQDNEKKWITKIVVQRVEFLDRKQNDNNETIPEDFGDDIEF